MHLPHEDWQHGKCGKLRKWMYGTQKAAKEWSEFAAGAMKALGFTRGRASPCVYHHKLRGLTCVVHGDDFTTLGTDRKLKWFHQQIQAHFEIKIRGIMGSGKDDVKEMRILNRIVRRTHEGFFWEADPRHAELLIRELELDKCQVVKTPGTRDRTGVLSRTNGSGPRAAVECVGSMDASGPCDADCHRDDPLMGPEATHFRALAARANFLAQDRSDVAFAAKEVCRKMASPHFEDWAKLKRMGRYLKGAPRAVYEYRWQDMPTTLDVYTDTDFAGCHETRKSTSGGVVLHGSHLLKFWSSTQTTVALSSAEAELYAM